MVKKENYDKFIFKGSLALESYADNTNNSLELFNEFNNKLKDYHSLKNKTDKEKEFIVNGLLSLLEIIGIDKFKIYDDGDVEYNYKI